MNVLIITDQQIRELGISSKEIESFLGAGQDRNFVYSTYTLDANSPEACWLLLKYPQLKTQVIQ